eukprot:scaffold2047_cov129-Cylindrotheca_fusiformis.AAC.4
MSSLPSAAAGVEEEVSAPPPSDAFPPTRDVDLATADDNRAFLLSTDTSETPAAATTVVNSRFKEDFEAEVLGLVRENGALIASPKTKRTSFMLTKGEFDKRVELLLDWESRKNRKTTNKSAYRWYNKNRLRAFSTSDGKKHIMQLAKDPSVHPDAKPWEVNNRYLTHHENVFDILNRYHSDGHITYGILHVRIKHIYCNISEKLCQEFVKRCPVCNLQPDRKKHIRGAVKPIESFKFRDRSLADLIDYREDPALMDPEGDPRTTPVYQWLLVVKDHFTRLVYLTPLFTKSAKGVARALDQYYSQVGYPLVFQTDNGGEFEAEVLECLKRLNPYCRTVTGRPRTPRDQGSVEKANQAIKRIIARMTAAARFILQSPEEKKKITWVTQIPCAMRAMNSMQSKGSNEVSPYRMVYGTGYHDPLVDGLQDVGGNTVEERVKFLHEDYKRLMTSIGATGTAELDFGWYKDGRFERLAIPEQELIVAVGDNGQSPKQQLPGGLSSSNSSSCGGNDAGQNNEAVDDCSLSCSGLPWPSPSPLDPPKYAAAVLPRKLSFENLKESDTDSVDSLLEPTLSSSSAKRKKMASLKSDDGVTTIGSTPCREEELVTTPAAVNPTTILVEKNKTGEQLVVSLKQDGDEKNKMTGELLSLKPLKRDEDDKNKTITTIGATASSKNDSNGRTTSGATASTNDKVVVKIEEATTASNIVMHVNRKAIPKRASDVLKELEVKEKTEKGRRDLNECVMGRLACTQCFENVVYSVPMFKEMYYKHHSQETTSWFEHSFVLAFLRLSAHCLHSKTIKVVDATPSNADVLEGGRNQNLPSQCLPKGITSLVFVALQSNHYAVVHIILSEVATGGVIEVFDGLHYRLDTWKEPIIRILKRYGLVPTSRRTSGALQFSDNYTPYTYYSQRTRNIKKEEEAPCCTGAWEVVHGDIEQQRDSSSCGPIACFTAYNLLAESCDKKKKIICTSVDEMRKTVIGMYKEFLKELDLPHISHVQYEDLTQQKTNKPDNDAGRPSVIVDLSIMTKGAPPAAPVVAQKKGNEGKDVDMSLHDHHCLSSFQATVLPKDNTSPTLVISNPTEEESAVEDQRKRAVNEKRRLKSLNEAKGRERQDRANKKAKRHFLETKEIQKGDTVLIRVGLTERNRANPLGFYAIVYDVAPKSKGVRVVTEHGIVSEGKGGNKVASWIPHEKWMFRDVALPNALSQKRCAILDGSFNPSNENMVSIKVAQQKTHCLSIVGVSKCGCKKKCTSASCRCRSRDTMCHSGCGCGGLCQHSREVADRVIDSSVRMVPKKEKEQEEGGAKVIDSPVRMVVPKKEKEQEEGGAKGESYVI